MTKYAYIFLILVFFLPINISAQKNLPSGYDKISWGTKISAAKESVKGKIIYTDDKKVIISREGVLKYHYGFFYLDPLLINKKEPAMDILEQKEAEKVDEGKLFFVSLEFPLISLKEIYRKYKNKYGEPTSKKLKKNQGAIVWDSNNTIIILWVNSYEEELFCQRVVYLSKEIAKELINYIDKIFNNTERELIKNLVQ